MRSNLLTNLLRLLWLLFAACLIGVAWAKPEPSPYVFLEGQAVDTRFGACLSQLDQFVFVRDVNQWMPGMAGTDRAHRYVVIGKLLEKFDLPVSSDPSEAAKKVIVPEGTDLHQASKRWQLTDVEGMFQADSFSHPLRDHKAVEVRWSEDFSVPAVPKTYNNQCYVNLKVPYLISQGDLNSVVTQLNKGGFESVLLTFLARM